MWLIKFELYIIFCVLIILMIHSEFTEKQNFNLKNEYVVRFLGSPWQAELLANELGYDFKGPVIGFPNTYLFTSKYKHLFQKRTEHLLSKRLNQDSRVVWVEKQEYKLRQKRDLIYPNQEFRRPKRQNLATFNDKLWPHQWYLQDTRTRSDLPKLDLNVLPVYRAGITGKNIRISILDDGLEHTHYDLSDNYDPNISWDLNDNDDDPSPRYGLPIINSHGTRCAGEVAMVAENSFCGVGIAYNAKIGGVRMLDGPVNDLTEGIALGYARHLVDIYSASWGPNDDGKTVEAPGTLAQEAIERGISQGRNGLGSIYIWASGNGGNLNDNCNCDGYIASPYTVAIGSASERGSFPWYGEQCASTIAVTYSSGTFKDQMIATTDLNNTCTIRHTGTSASAPLAAGIVALVLETNPYLTWRDIQHLIIWTSEHLPVSENPGWSRNSAGLWFNTRFGFGLMNAYSMVITAANWTNVPDKQICNISSERQNYIFISGQKVFLSFETTNCKIKYLEHVEVTVNLEYTFRGALEMFLESPKGTNVQILAKRIFDNSKKGFRSWTFMSVMTWGENPSGIWVLKITDQNTLQNNSGVIGRTWLTIHGTETIPNHMIDGPRNYATYQAEKEKLWNKNNVYFNNVNNNYRYNYWNMQ